MQRPVSLFISHGSPMITVERSPAADFLRGLGQVLPRPRAVIAISAHWPLRRLRVGAAPWPAAIHDFQGFPPQLHELEYPAPGDADLAKRIAQAIDAELDVNRGLDHGIWTIMHLIWPEADIPIVPLSVLHGADAAAHMKIGHTLRSFVDDDVMVVGTGAATHNLASMTRERRDAEPKPWVSAFVDELAELTLNDQRDALADWRKVLPYARENHPDDDHLSPFFVALGAGKGPGRVLHRSVEHAAIAMDAYAWD